MRACRHQAENERETGSRAYRMSCALRSVKPKHSSELPRGGHLGRGAGQKRRAEPLGESPPDLLAADAGPAGGRTLNATVVVKGRAWDREKPNHGSHDRPSAPTRSTRIVGNLSPPSFGCPASQTTSAPGGTAPHRNDARTAASKRSSPRWIANGIVTPITPHTTASWREIMSSG